MDESRFWELIDQTRSSDVGRHAAQLARVVASYGPEQTRAFDEIWQAKRVAAYRWDLWAAAYEIFGGCSDDGFADFRNYLISLGASTYQGALDDPDSLVELDIPPELEAEEISYVGQMAYEQLQVEPPIYAHSDPSEPLGEKWSEAGDGSKNVVPRLAAKYRA